MTWTSLIPPAAGLLLAPMLAVGDQPDKAFLAGRHGQPMLQPYLDLVKLFRKGATYSRTTTWIFRAGPIVGLAAVAATLAVLPMGGLPAPIHFRGDLVLFAYLLGLMRFVTVLAALDTGSSFEGWERAARCSLRARRAGSPPRLGRRGDGDAGRLDVGNAGVRVGRTWGTQGPALGLVVVAIGLVLLTENARIPIDDPPPTWS